MAPKVNDQASNEAIAFGCHVELHPEVTGSIERAKKGNRSATAKSARAPPNVPLRRSARNDTMLRSAGNTDDFGTHWHMPGDFFCNGPPNPPNVQNTPDTSYPQDPHVVAGPDKEWCTTTYDHVYYTRWDVQTLRADAQDLGASAARQEDNDVAAYDHREEIAAAQGAEIAALKQTIATQGAKIDALTDSVQNLVQVLGPLDARLGYLATQKGYVDGVGEGFFTLEDNEGEVRANEKS